MNMHVFAYSGRKNTPAVGFPNQVPEDVKRERSQTLIALAQELHQKHLIRMIEEKKPLRVLFETQEGDFWRGHSDEFAEVEVRSACPLRGQFRLVLPLIIAGDKLLGVIYDEK
ncbi:MAG: hypothetical protein MJ078_02725 [Clostridia bacterium]|nr:hypothetical protein [Clostridia bacterium]